MYVQPAASNQQHMRQISGSQTVVRGPLDEVETSLTPHPTPEGPQDDRRGSAERVKNCLKFQIRLSDQIRLTMSHNVVY